MILLVQRTFNSFFILQTQETRIGERLRNILNKFSIIFSVKYIPISCSDSTFYFSV